MRKKIINNKMLNEKGGITVLVLFTVLTFVVVLMGAFMSVSALRESQLKSNIRIKEIYKEDVKRVDEVYDDIIGEDDVYTLPYDNPYVPKGFEHIGTANWNSGYQIKDEKGNIFVWVPCVIEESQIKVEDDVQVFDKTLPSTTDITAQYYMYNKNSSEITGDESSATAIGESVGKYGGFYIAAYEAGVPLAEDGTEIEPTSALVTQKARSVKGAKAWTNIKREDAITASANMIDETSEVKSGLISGECWDTTLKWMAYSSTNATNEPNVNYDICSTKKGYYGQTDKTTTGCYSINNIYDMAGNVCEWTTENSNSYFVMRGGWYNQLGSDHPAAHREVNYDTMDSNTAFRVVLYK